MSLLDSFRLDDKVVIVTGASSGLGVAFAQGFAEAGADLVLGARRVEKMADTAALVASYVAANAAAAAQAAAAQAAAAYAKTTHEESTR